MNRDFLFSSIRNKLPNTKSTEHNNRIQGLYWLTKSFTPGKEPNMETCQTTSIVWQEGNENLNDYTLCIYKHRCGEIGTDHLIIPCYIPNVRRKQNHRLPSRGQCADGEVGNTDDIGIHSCGQNGLVKRWALNIYTCHTTSQTILPIEDNDAAFPRGRCTDDERR